MHGYTLPLVMQTAKIEKFMPGLLVDRSESESKMNGNNISGQSDIETTEKNTQHGWNSVHSD